MCKRGTEQLIWVKIPADLSYTEKETWKFAKIDDCIAPLVAALQAAGIDMRGSCCGHDKGPGDIHLQDGRLLLILSPEKAQRYMSGRKRRSRQAPKEKPMCDMKHIHLMYSEEGDWVGLYLDGKLAYEGHSIEVTMLLDLLGLKYTMEERDLGDGSRCPPTLEEKDAE